VFLSEKSSKVILKRMLLESESESNLATTRDDNFWTNRIIFVIFNFFIGAVFVCINFLF